MEQANEHGAEEKEEGKVMEEVSVDEVVLEGSDEEWLDWRVGSEEKVLKESSGTDTRQAEQENTTTGTGLPVAESEISRFAKRSKTRDFAHFVPDSPGTQKVLTPQLVPDLPASQKLLTAQLVPELAASPKMLDKQMEQECAGQ